MTQEYKDLLYSVENAVAWVRFNRPQVLNALTQDLHVELHQAVRQVKNDPEARVMVITGVGRGFAAGRDMEEQAEGLTGEFRSFGTGDDKPSGNPWEIGLEMWNMQKPIIAAVNGVAVGGGLSIVLESDIILASKNATFGAFFIRRGVVSSGLGQWLLPRLIGMHRAKEMLMLGELIDAEQAKEWGLVNHVYPADEFEDRVREFAEKLAQGPAQVIGLMKRLVNDGMSMSIEATGRAEMQADGVLLTRYRDQVNEGIASYLEKRAPLFDGAIVERQWSEEKYK
ncbi:MAG: enoyl-CoA hydratase/isomerase family protein [Dehalococcoidales bacterium]|nr:MAG: enoyl-CoA hydratase/isomerase family protein [Dehalococcoidales bacterium]